ncbi:MAG: tetratricopeptide repeat protein [Bacteroidia bacterium]
MKKVVIALFMFFVLAAGTMMAQDPNGKVTTGVIAYDGSRYDEAIIKLNEALAKSGELKPKNVPKMHYFLMQSYMRAVGDNANKDLKAKYPNADEMALDHLLKLKETVAQASGADANTYKTGIAMNEYNLWVMLFNKGNQQYGEGNYQSALSSLEKAYKLSPDKYLSSLMLGFAQVMNKDSAAAITSFEKAISLHDAYLKTPVKANDKPVVADSNMINGYLSLANMQMKYKKESQKAIDILGAGMKMFPNNKGTEDLKITELSIYQQEPSLLQTALTKFEASMKSDPKNLPIAIAYANLLEKANRAEEALNVYKEVLTRDPKNTIANLNLGAFYVNKSAELSKAMQDEKDETKSNALLSEINNNFRLALPLIRQVHLNEPKEIEWVTQLVQITSYLMLESKEMEEEFNKFLKLQTEMRSNK